MGANRIVRSGKASIERLTANERLRMGWDSRVRWGVVVAVGLHAAAFVVSPTWTARSVGLPEGPRGGIELLALGAADTALVLARPAARPAPPAPVPAEDAADDESSLRGGAANGDGEQAARDLLLGDAWAAFDGRLRRRGPLEPSISTVRVGEDRGSRAQPEPREIVDEEGDPEIDVDETIPDLTLPEPDSLTLERLAAVRPELALTATSAWVLIRNQGEIETYLNRSYTDGRLDRSAEGSVSVTLWIDPRGSVEWAEITESSGNRDLDEFALALFNEVADFRAARDQGARVSRSVTFSLTFPW